MKQLREPERGPPAERGPTASWGEDPVTGIER